MAESSTSKTLFLLILAIVFGILAAIFTALYLKNKEAALIARIAGEQEQMISVLVPNQNLPKGLKLQESMLTWADVPSQYVQSDVILPADYRGIVGRFLKVNVEQNKPMHYSFLDEEFPVDFSDLVAEGRRAITIQVDEIRSFSGFLRPGNFIDLYVNIETKIVGYQEEGTDIGNLPSGFNGATPEAQAAEQFASQLLSGLSTKAVAKDAVIPVLQDLKVLATGREAYQEHLDNLSYPQQRTGRNYTSITLDVSPKEAALLAMAEDKGELIAVLRNRNDRDVADFSSLTPFDMFEHAKDTLKQAELRKAAAAAGATIDEDGNWVTADGKVIKAEDIIISDNGTVTTKSGQLLAADGITMNENGEYVDANGNVIPEDQLVFNADGTVTTKDEIMKAAGYTINENGDYVDANGNIIKKEDVKVLANGTVMSADGKVLAGDNVTVNEHGFIIAEDGTVMTADGKVLTGVTVDENGNVIGPDGQIMTDANLIVDADGTVRDKDGNVIAGISGSSVPPGFGEAASDIPDPDELMSQLPSIYQLIIGGSSTDGVPSTQTLPVQPVQPETALPTAP